MNEERQTGRTLAMLREAAQVAPKLPPKMTVVVVEVPCMEAYCRDLAAAHGLDISRVRFVVPSNDVASKCRTIQSAFVDHSCPRDERHAAFWEAIDRRVRNPLVRVKYRLDWSKLDAGWEHDEARHQLRYTDPEDSSKFALYSLSELAGFALSGLPPLGHFQAACLKQIEKCRVLEA